MPKVVRQEMSVGLSQDYDFSMSVISTPSFLDAMASSSTYPCQSMSGSVIDSFRLEIAIASPSFASLFNSYIHALICLSLIFYRRMIAMTGLLLLFQHSSASAVCQMEGDLDHHYHASLSSIMISSNQH